MISWIQKYFQKHFRLVFLAVLIAIGLPMVVIYSAGGGGHSDNIKVLERPFFHQNLANPETSRRIGVDAELSAFLRAGYPALQGGQLQQYALQRVAGLALADELHLPQPTPDQVSKHVLTLRAFQNQQGQFDQSVYTRFADSLKGGAGGATIGDVNRVLRDDVRLGDLTKLLGGPGYLLPIDVTMQLSREDSLLTTQVATLDYDKFQPAINPTEDALKKFHEENSFRYDVPARPKLSLVEFKAADYPIAISPTEEELRTYYNQNPAAFPVPAEAADKKETGTPDNFTKVRPQVESALRAAASRRLASNAANQLTIAIYERKFKANSPQLEEYIVAQKRAIVPVAPFAPGRPPADRAWLANQTAALNRLNSERFFSDPLPTPEGYAVLLWNDSLPAYKPSLLEVRDRVIADYRESERRRLFVERGNTLKSELQSAAQTPAGFAARAAAEKLEVKSYAAFTLRQPPQDFPPAAFDALMTLPAGQVSSLISTEDKGYLVFMQEKKGPDLSPANPRYVDVQQRYSALLANYSQSAAIGELVEEELKKSAPAGAP